MCATMKGDNKKQRRLNSAKSRHECTVEKKMMVRTKLGQEPGFSLDLNFQNVMTSKLKNLDVSVQNLEVLQWAYKTV